MEQPTVPLDAAPVPGNTRLINMFIDALSLAEEYELDIVFRFRKERQSVRRLLIYVTDLNNPTCDEVDVDNCT